MSLHLLSLPEAVNEIVNAVRPRTWHTPQTPYFFIAGAGISYPSIPLASGIEELCQKEIIAHGGIPVPVRGTPMERYEAIFQAAFPHPEARRAFLHHHISSARISAANFRLAHLVSSGKPANLVVTTNFDELLTKALRLFGRDVIVCDHPQTTQRIDPKRDDLQVIHVHGTHWFYDCCNLKEEIHNRAAPRHEDTTGMSPLLDRILYDRSPLIIGYSGWEGDVVMGALKRRLSQPLRYNMYWFCHKRSELDTLPSWLKEHSNVRFVVPPLPLQEPQQDTGTTSTLSGLAAHTAPPPPGDTTDPNSKAPTLTALQVLDALISGLKLNEPDLTKDPLDFFEKLLTNLIASDVSDEDDIYLVKSVIRHVRSGAELVRNEKERRSRKEQETAVLLERVNKAVRSAAYAEASTIAGEIEIPILSESQRLDLDNALDAIYKGIDDTDALLGVEICKRRIALCEAALSRSPQDVDWMTRQVKAMASKGHFLRISGRLAESISAQDEFITKFGDASELSLRKKVAQALIRKGVAQSESGHSDEAITSYNEIIQRFGTAMEPSLLESVAHALIRKGQLLSERNREQEAIAAYKSIVERFGETSEPLLTRQVAWALFLLGVTLSRTEQTENASEAYEEIVSRFGDSTEPTLREQVAHALIEKGRMLKKKNQTSSATEAFNETVRRFGDATELPLKVLVARALISKGMILLTEHQERKAIDTFHEVVQRFDQATEPKLQALVAWAFLGEGSALIELESDKEALTALDEVAMRFGEVPDQSVKKLVAESLITKAIVLAESNARAKAIAAFDEVVRRFGEDPDPALKEATAKALINKGITLERDGAMTAAVASFDEVVRRFSEAAEPVLKEPVARALVSKGIALTADGAETDAIVTFDEVVRRLSGATETAQTSILAQAFINKGVALRELKRQTESILAFDEVIHRFGEAEEPSLRELVAQAFEHKGAILDEDGTQTEAILAYEEIVRRFGQAPDSPLKEIVIRAREKLSQLDSTS